MYNYSSKSLGLDEALISLNKSAQLERPLQVYYQLTECFGCPLERLEASQWDQLVVSTRHSLQLEVREPEKGAGCQFQTLTLNSRARYRIDVEGSRSPNGTGLVCSFATLDQGDCWLCPIATLLCLLLFMTGAEALSRRFFARRAAKRAAASDDGANTASSPPADPDSIQEAPSKRPAGRIESLDAFRGLTIAGMIMVNYGGAGYSFLQHSAWDGATPADFVFPFFIFSMGASIALSTRSMVRHGKRLGQMLVRVVRRSIILMTLGWCLNSKALAGQSLEHLRLTGVLQRFSVSYLAVAGLYSIELAAGEWLRMEQRAHRRTQLLTGLAGALLELLAAIGLLSLYGYMSFYFRYSEYCPAGYLGPGGQTEEGRYADCTGGAATWLDRLLVDERHLYNDTEVREVFRTRVSHDPEGLLGYTTSILLTLIGLQCGKIMGRSSEHRTRLLMFAQWIVLLSLSCSLVVLVPINKRLWSLTFVTLTGAAAYLLVALLYLLLDVIGCRQTFLLRLLVCAGKNAIFLYVGHSLLGGMLPWHFAVDETSRPQLLMRLIWSTFVWLLAAGYMASKRLFITI